MILDEEIGGDTCHGRSCHILYESSYSLQIKSVRKLHDKLITFRRSDKSVFYRILAAETCFPPTPFPYAQRQSESGFTYFNEKLQNLYKFSFLSFLFINVTDRQPSYLKYFFNAQSNYRAYCINDSKFPIKRSDFVRFGRVNTTCLVLRKYRYSISCSNDKRVQELEEKRGDFLLLF